MGEAFFNRMLERFTNPEDQFKSGCLLQLETDFKTRLRTFLIAHGISMIEREDWRQEGRDLADTLKGESWQEVVTDFAGMVAGFVAGFKEMQPAVLPIYKDLGNFMMDHEQSIHDFALQEVAGNAETSIDGVINMLVNPLSRLSPALSAKTG